MTTKIRRTSSSRGRGSRRKASDPTTAYAQRVVAGELLAGPNVRLACARHLRDLEEGPSRGLRWNPLLTYPDGKQERPADRILRYFPTVLRLNGGEYEGKPFVLEPWEQFVVGSLFGWVKADGYRRFRVAFVETAKGSGKSPLAAGIGHYMLTADGEARAEVYAAAPLALTTPIPTPSGWTTMADIREGDLVFDDQGHPTAVTYVSPVQHNRECFQLTFHDGESIIADGAHRWATRSVLAGSLVGVPQEQWSQRAMRRSVSVRTTTELLETLRTPRGASNHSIDVAGALDLPSASLPIPPYTLGVWLGDGRSNRGCAVLHPGDADVLRFIEADGYRVSRHGLNAVDGLLHFTVLGLRGQLRASGLLDNKHIPAPYLRGSHEQRMALLAGLMDTDGTCTKTGECRFTNRNRAIAEGVRELALGLGLLAHLGVVEVTGKPHYRVSFRATVPVFRLARKHGRQRAKVTPRAARRYLTGIAPHQSVPVRCISVAAPSSLYLVGRGMIPTHNTKKDQAQVLFRDAVAMVDQSPALSRRLLKSGGNPVWNLAHLATGSFFRPISSEDDGQSGPRPHCALLDEIHEHRTDVVVQMMRAGTKSRRQALIFEITNSGFDRHSVCYQHHEYSEKVLQGSLEDDAWFAFVCGLDPCPACRAEGQTQPKDGCADCDDWRDPTVWSKANPSLGVTIREDYLAELVREAIGMPAKQNLVKRLNFCIWTEQSTKALDMTLWDLGKTPVDVEALRGQRCYGGLDLAQVSDLSSLCLVFPRPEPVWPVLWWCWCPADDIQVRAKKDRVPYDVWVREGLIAPTPGNTTDYTFIQRDILSLATIYDIREIAFDRTFTGQIVQNLQAELGEERLVQFGQGFLSMASPTAELLRRVKAGEIQHGNNPVARWAASNLSLATDAAGNLKPDKEHSTERIDPMTALVMGFGRAMLAPVTGDAFAVGVL